MGFHGIRPPLAAKVGCRRKKSATGGLMSVRWLLIGKGYMSNIADELFRFVTKPEIKSQITLDLSELHSCMKQGLLKASVVLTGALIECVLYYHIESVDSIRNTIPRFTQRDVGLSDLLQWARQYDVIDNNLFRLSEPIRDYRNLIHPRVRERTKTQLSENLVQIGYNVLLEIVRSVNRHYNVVQSQKAESIVARKVNEVASRSPTKADFHVYVPILEKYGYLRGELIIERSLRAGKRKRS